MTFEFSYDPSSEEIFITYDNQVALSAFFDGEEIVYSGFEKIRDDDVERILKSLCRQIIHTFN